MKKIDKIKKMLRIIIILFAAVILIYTVIFVLPKRKVTVKEEDKIMDYVLYESNTEFYKEVFSKLKEELKKEEIDYKKYAEYMSELFIIDLYTLEGKNNKTDIGGKMYIFDSIKKNFILNASNTLYKYVGLQKELPKVNSIELLDIKDSEYSLNDKNYNGYKVYLKWGYEKDLGYDNEGCVIVIRDNDKLYVVEKNDERID